MEPRSLVESLPLFLEILPTHVVVVTVVLTAYDEERRACKTVCFMGRGDSFGDLAIINRAPRECNVITKDHVELLCLSEEVKCPDGLVMCNMKLEQIYLFKFIYIYSQLFYFMNLSDAFII